MPKKRVRSSPQKDRLRKAIAFMRDAGVPCFVNTQRGVAEALRAAGVVPIETRVGAALNYAAAKRMETGDAGLLPTSAVSAFYQTPQWQRLAYQCKLRDGRRCMCCGATPADGVRIVSDHIVPIRLRWDLRLEPTNIQSYQSGCDGIFV